MTKVKVLDIALVASMAGIVQILLFADKHPLFSMYVFVISHMILAIIFEEIAKENMNE